MRSRVFGWVLVFAGIRMGTCVAGDVSTFVCICACWKGRGGRELHFRWWKSERGLGCVLLELGVIFLPSRSLSLSQALGFFFSALLPMR